MNSNRLFTFLMTILVALPGAWVQADTMVATRVVGEGEVEVVWQGEDGAGDTVLRTNRYTALSGEVGRNHRRVELVSPSIGNPMVYVTNRYVVLANGLNHRDALGNWVESSPTLTGYAEAIVGTGGGHRVILSHDLGQAGGGSVDYESAAGERIVLQPLAILLFDPESGESITLGTITSCTAEIVQAGPPGRVIWRNAFAGISASVVIEYARGRLSQEVVLEEKVTLPSSFSPRSRIEVVTEILESPAFETTEHVQRRETDAAKRAQMVEPDVIDETISFGTAVMKLGWAFDSGETAARGAPVAKRIMDLEDGRRVLIESVEWSDPRVQEALERLPQRSARVDEQAQPGREVPQRRMAGIQRDAGDTGWGSSFEARLAAVKAEGSEKTMMASVAPAGSLQEGGRPAGFVIDYETLDSSLQDVNFSGETYLLDGNVTVQNAYFGSGAVFKYEAGTTLTVWGDVSFGGSPVCTAEDDDSVGDTISGSSGSPSGRYADTALNFYYLSSDLSTSYGPDIRHAETGIYIYGQQSYGHSIYSSLLYECDLGVYASSCSISLYGTDFCEVDTWSGGSVSNSSYTECEADRDSDGLPDNWEFTYFGDLDQGGGGDYEGDGMTNLQEYQQGTSPDDFDSDNDGVIDQAFAALVLRPAASSILP